MPAGAWCLGNLVGRQMCIREKNIGLEELCWGGPGVGCRERRAVDGEEPGRCHVVLGKGKVRGGHWGSLSKWDTSEGGLMGRA